MILVVIGIFTYNYSSNALKNKIGTYSEQLVERVAIELNEIQKSYERISDNVAFSDLIQQKLASFDELNDDEKIAFKSEVANSFSELI